MLAVLTWAGGTGVAFPWPRNIWQCLQTALVVTTWGCKWVRMLLPYSKEQPEMLLNIPQCTNQPSTTKQYWAQNVNNPEAEKSWLKVMEKEDIFLVRDNNMAAPRLLTGLRARSVWSAIAWDWSHLTQAFRMVIWSTTKTFIFDITIRMSDYSLLAARILTWAWSGTWVVPPGPKTETLGQCTSSLGRAGMMPQCSSGWSYLLWLPLAAGLLVTNILSLWIH